MRILVCPDSLGENVQATPVALFSTDTRCIWCGELLVDHEELAVSGSGTFDPNDRSLADRTGDGQDDAVRSSR